MRGSPITSRRPWLGWAAGLLAIVGLGCSAIGVGVTGGGGGIGMGMEAHPAPSPTVAESQALMDRINRHRLAIGCRALTWDGRLAAVARKHSEDMVRRRYFDRVDPDGKGPGDRLKAAGISYLATAENLAEGQFSGRDVYDDWIESRGQRENMENCEYTHLDVGFYQRTWTLVLVRFP